MINSNLNLYIVSILFQTVLSGFAPYQQLFLRNKGFTHGTTGVIIALSQLVAVAMALLLCGFSDRTRKTRSVLVIVSCLSLFLFAVSVFSNITFIVVIGFAAMAIMSVSGNPLVDGYIDRNVARLSDYGKIRAAGTMGYVVFMFMASVISYPKQSNNIQIFIALALKMLFFIVACLLFTKNDTTEISYQTVNKKETIFDSSWFDKSFYLFIVMYFISRIANSVPEKLLSSYMTEVLGLGSSFTAFIALGATVEFICLIVFARYLKGKIERCFNLMIISGFALALRLLIYRMHPSIPLFAFAQMLHGLTFGAAHIGSINYVAYTVKKEHYSLGISFVSAIATSIPEMLGSFFGGYIIQYMGYDSLFSIYAIFPAISAVFAIILRARYIKAAS